MLKKNTLGRSHLFCMVLTLVMTVSVIQEKCYAECTFKKMAPGVGRDGGPCEPVGLMDRFLDRLSDFLPLMLFGRSRSPQSVPMVAVSGKPAPLEVEYIPDATDNEYIEAALKIGAYFKKDSKVSMLIQKMNQNIANGGDLRQESYELTKELYRLMAPPPEYYAFRSKKKAELEVWSSQKDPLLNSLAPLGDGVSVRDVSIEMTAFIERTLQFIQNRIPDVYSCFSSTEKPLKVGQFDHIFGNKPQSLSQVVVPQTKKDLARSYASLSVKDEEGQWHQLKELYTPPKEGDEQAAMHPFEVYDDFLAKVEKNHPVRQPEKWAGNGVFANAEPIPAGRKAAHYLLYSTSQGPANSLYVEEVGKRFINSGLGAKLGFPLGTDRWTSLDIERGQVENYFLLTVNDPTARKYVLPSIAQATIHCDSVEDCQKQTFTNTPLPFAGEGFPKREELISTLGLDKNDHF